MCRGDRVAAALGRPAFAQLGRREHGAHGRSELQAASRWATRPGAPRSPPRFRRARPDGASRSGVPAGGLGGAPSRLRSQRPTRRVRPVPGSRGASPGGGRSQRRLPRAGTAAPTGLRLDGRSAGDVRGSRRCHVGGARRWWPGRLGRVSNRARAAGGACQRPWLRGVVAAARAAPRPPARRDRLGRYAPADPRRRSPPIPSGDGFSAS